MDALKVKDLYRMLGKLVKEGHGEKTILVASEQSCNDFHLLWFSPTTNPDEIKKVIGFSCDGLPSYDDVVLIG